jgi:hypothetical protein
MLSLSPLMPIATEAFMAEQRQRREQASARLAPDVFAVVEEVAAAERHPLSSVVRNVVSDWAAKRRRTASRSGGRMSLPRTIAAAPLAEPVKHARVSCMVCGAGVDAVKAAALVGRHPFWSGYQLAMRQ